MIAECNSYWQNITCTGRIWLILTEHNLYWQNLTSIGRMSLLPAECDFHWQNMIYTGWLSLWLVEYDLYLQNMTSIGRIWFILAYYHSYWQNMQPIKSVLPFCSALPIQYTRHRVSFSVLILFMKIFISPEWIYPVAKQTENNALINLAININSQHMFYVWYFKNLLVILFSDVYDSVITVIVIIIQAYYCSLISAIVSNKIKK